MCKNDELTDVILYNNRKLFFHGILEKPGTQLKLVNKK